jgi:hypothetical protein
MQSPVIPQNVIPRMRRATGPVAWANLMTENRNGLIVDARLTEANGTAERATALDMVDDNAKPGSTVGADKNYDTSDFVAGCRERGCTPNVAQNNTHRRSAIDARTTRHTAIGSVRLDQNRWWLPQDEAPRPRLGRMVLRPHGDRLQPHSDPNNLAAVGCFRLGRVKYHPEQILCRYFDQKHHQNTLPSLSVIQTLEILASDDRFSATC